MVKYPTDQTKHIRAWIKVTEKTFVGDRSEWTRAQKRMLNIFDNLIDAVEERQSREQILRVGE